MEMRLYRNEEIAEVAESAEAFYLAHGYHDDWGGVREAILGSQLLALAYDGERIIGAGKVVGDGIRFSTIVDLFVDQSYRGRGLGSELVQTLAKACHTKHIHLSTDPKDPRLTEFYKKAGFVLFEGSSIFRWPG